MEFFDDKKNWGETAVRTGRSWKVEELRIKSNTDLHKLWYFGRFLFIITYLSP
jgi:large subunit ribosomal protein L47